MSQVSPQGNGCVAGVAPKEHMPQELVRSPMVVKGNREQKKINKTVKKKATFIFISFGMAKEKTTSRGNICLL